ncbi:MAG: OadG family protein [Anaerolineae bacterium]
MSDLLLEALRYTLIGMSMTFAALGALVLGMYVLTSVASRKKETASEATSAPTPPVAQAAESRDEARALAAAAAVAVAVAQAAGQPGYGHELRGASEWRHYVRQHHLEQRWRATQGTYPRCPKRTRE